MNKRDRNEIREAIQSLILSNKSEKPDEGWMTARDIAKLLGIGERTSHQYIRTMIEKGIIPPGRPYRILSGGMIKRVNHYRLPDSVTKRSHR